MGVDFKNINSLDGWKLNNSEYRAMLDYIEPKCFIEASATGQWGTVVKVIRNKDKIPVCIKVRYSNRHGKNNMIDYISVDRIDFFEPYRNCVSNLLEFYNCDREDETY
jgi:hypothetical protein